MEKVGILAGRGLYPHLFCQSAKKAGVKSVHVVGFHEDTDPELAKICESFDLVYVSAQQNNQTFPKKRRD